MNKKEIPKTQVNAVKLLFMGQNLGGLFELYADAVSPTPQSELKYFIQNPLMEGKTRPDWLKQWYVRGLN